MALTFTRAPEVDVGDPITSRDYNKLAAAFNDRLRSGVGDPTWRIWWRAHSVVRQWCNSSGLQTAPVDDYWKYWNLVDPRKPEVNFECVAGPFDDGPMRSFHTGQDTFDGEADRINAVQAGGAASLSAAWSLAAEQRGGQASTGEFNAPAIEAGYSHQWINYMGFALPYLKNYGGFFPGPRIGEQIDSCWEGWDMASYEPVEFVFSPLVSGVQLLVFTPLCESDPDYEENVYKVEEDWEKYYLFQLNGDIIELLKSEYVEGPYTNGGQLAYSNGRQLLALTSKYAQEFKGDKDQRADPAYNILNSGFDFQSFFTRQYPLAPAYADVNSGVLDVTYHAFTFSSYAAGDYADFDGGGNSYTIHDGYVLGGYYLVVADVDNTVPLVFNIIDENDNVIRRVSVPTSGEELYYFPTPTHATIRLQLVTDLTPGATVTFQFAELLAYKPTLEDAYFVLRKMTTNGDALSTLDVCGLDYDEAKTVFDNFWRCGCAYSGDAVPDGQVLEGNPTYDAMRQWFTRNLRFVGRQFVFQNPLRGYWTDEDGVSYLRFRRYGFYGGQTYDLFRNIAPPDEAQTKILSGVRYRVMNGSVTYHSNTYGSGSEFTGEAGYSEFTTEDGGECWQLDGIIHDAPADAESNEWTMFISFNHYRDGSVDWDPEDFGDIRSFLHNRCLAGDAYLGPTESEDLWNHYTYGSSGSPHVEAPSGYNYARSANSFYLSTPNGNADAPFFASCPVYKADYEVDTCTVEGFGNEQDVIIKLKTRLQTTPLAEAVVPEDQSQWPMLEGDGSLGECETPCDYDTVFPTVPPYRTDENGVREYLMYISSLGSQCSFLPGDEAEAGLISGTGCDGACHPRFYFTRLVPKVHVDEPDDNDVVDSTDTRCVADTFNWMHFMLSAICEGYVDQQNSVRDACPDVKLPDYNLQNLIYQSHDCTAHPLVDSTLSGSTLTWDDSVGGPFLIQKLVDWFGWDVWQTIDTVMNSPYTVSDPGAEHRVVKVFKCQNYFQGFPVSARGENLATQGPIANTIMYADVFNQFSRALNLLTWARIELPLDLEYRIINTQVFWYVATGLENDTEPVLGDACGSTSPNDPYVSSYAPNAFHTEIYKYYQDDQEGNYINDPLGIEGEVVSTGSWTALTSGQQYTLTRTFEPEWDYVSTTAVTMLRCDNDIGIKGHGGGFMVRSLKRTCETAEIRVDPTSVALGALSADLIELLEQNTSAVLWRQDNKSWWEQDDGAPTYNCPCGGSPSADYLAINPVAGSSSNIRCDVLDYDALREGIYVFPTEIEQSLLYLVKPGWACGGSELMCVEGPSSNTIFAINTGNLMIKVPFAEET